MGQLCQVEECLCQAEGGTADPHVRGHVLSIRAYSAGLRGDMSAAAQLLRGALELLPQDDHLARGFATSLLGSVLRWSGELSAAEELSMTAIAMREAGDDRRLSADAFCDLAALQITKGQLRQATATCHAALLAANQETHLTDHASVAGFAHARMSAVLLEGNDLENALAHARRGIELAARWGWADALVFGYGYLASALQASGDTQAALVAVRQGRDIAGTLSSWLEAQMAAQEAELLLEQGKIAQAWRWAEASGLHATDIVAFQDGDLYLTLAKILISYGHQRRSGSWVQQGLELLERLLAMADAAGASGRVIQILVAKAIALQTEGQLEPALDALRQALDLAEPEGYLNTFVRQGPTMRHLLQVAASRGAALAYVTTILGAFNGSSSTCGPGAFGSPRLAEALSERELQVLRLLAVGMSSREIANQLFISINTARTHIKNIYGKLEVHGRLEATERAREFGLLQRLGRRPRSSSASLPAIPNHPSLSLRLSDDWSPTSALHCGRIRSPDHTLAEREVNLEMSPRRTLASSPMPTLPTWPMRKRGDRARVDWSYVHVERQLHRCRAAQDAHHVNSETGLTKGESRNASNPCSRSRARLRWPACCRSH